MTPEETAKNIISETQLIDNTVQEAHQVKTELVTLIAQAIRAAVEAEREACAQIAFDAGGGIGEWIAEQLRAQTEQTP